jgi:16S rRNA (uracil1498-N3)-methyltransferase
MNLISLRSSDFISDSRVEIRDSRRLAHIVSVHGVELGASYKMGLIDGLMGNGTLVESHSDALIFDVSLTQNPPDALPLTLILGLPRPKMLRRIFQTIATLGVKKLHIVNSYRVEKSYWQTPFLTPAAIEEQLLLGLEQGCDTLMPQVFLHKRFKPFVEDELPAVIAGTNALVAHPYTETSCPRAVTGPTSLAVGPEGGFIPYEIDLLQNAGFEAVHLGSRIMRVETAIPHLIGRLF